MDITQEYIKTVEFKKIFGLHRNTVINWIRTGKIKAQNINNHWYIPVSEVERIKSEGA